MVGVGFELASLAWSRRPGSGASASPSIRDCADAMAGVTRVERVLTMRRGRERVVVALGLRVEPALSASEVRVTVARVERAIRRAHPSVERVLLAVHGGR